MQVSRDEARQALDAIQDAGERTRRVLVEGYGGGLLMVIWGLLVFVAYLATYFLVIHKLYGRITWIWWIMGAIGWVATWLIYRRSPIRSPQDIRCVYFWLCLAAFSFIWLMLLWPWNGAQLNLFLITMVMFAYVVIGIWAWRVMLWLGLGVTGLIMAGYLLLGYDPLLWLWMAVAVGAPLTLTGAALILKARG